MRSTSPNKNIWRKLKQNKSSNKRRRPVGLKLIENERQFEILLASVQYEWLRGMMVGLYLMENKDHRLEIAYNAFMRPVKDRSSELVRAIFKENEIRATMAVIFKYCAEQTKYLLGDSDQAATSIRHLNYGTEEVKMLDGIIQVIKKQAEAQGLEK